jgi:hypothetical protein
MVAHIESKLPASARCPPHTGAEDECKGSADREVRGIALPCDVRGDANAKPGERNETVPALLPSEIERDARVEQQERHILGAAVPRGRRIERVDDVTLRERVTAVHAEECRPANANLVAEPDDRPRLWPHASRSLGAAVPP